MALAAKISAKTNEPAREIKAIMGILAKERPVDSSRGKYQNWGRETARRDEFFYGNQKLRTTVSFSQVRAKTAKISPFLT